MKNNISLTKKEICIILDLINDKLDLLINDDNDISNYVEDLLNLQSKLTIMLINESTKKSNIE